MGTSEALETRIAKLKERLKGIPDKEQEKGTSQKVRQIKKSLKRAQRKLRKLRPAKETHPASAGEAKAQEATPTT